MDMLYSFNRGACVRGADCVRWALILKGGTFAVRGVILQLGVGVVGIAMNDGEGESFGWGRGRYVDDDEWEV